MSTKQPQPWRGNLFKDKDLAAWDVQKVDRVLEQGTNPRASLELVLRSANTLRRCVESAQTQTQKVAILNHPSVVPVLYYWLRDRAQHAGPSGTRLKEHILFTFVHILGSDNTKDEILVCDERFLTEVLCALLVDEDGSVATAAAQLVRKISELDHVSGVIPFTDSVMAALVDALTAAFAHHDHECLGHLLSTLINLTGNQKAQFGLARNKQLVHLLVVIIRHAGVGGSRDVECGSLAIKALANLLYYPENYAAMKADEPDLALALVECAKAVDENISDPNLRALANVATVALEYCHDRGVEALEVEMHRELQGSPASLLRVGYSRRRAMNL